VLDVLATLAGGAHLVVVRHRHVSKASTILTPSTGARLAGRSTSPVVSVPPPWASLDRKVARVVLGVHDIPGSLPLVQEALSLADLHEVDLLVVHALGLPLPTAIDDPGTERLLPVWHEEATVQLDTILRLAWRGFPRVDVRSTVVDGKPAQALAAVTSVDDLLVLGRQRAAHADHGRLGKVGRALIARGTCPVLFVPGPPTPHATAREPAHAQR
jgi:nucleotide-binding universal stress UspA family protein